MDDAGMPNPRFGATIQAILAGDDRAFVASIRSERVLYNEESAEAFMRQLEELLQRRPDTKGRLKVEAILAQTRQILAGTHLAVSATR